MSHFRSLFLLSTVTLSCINFSFAAKPIDLSEQPATSLQALSISSQAKTISSSIDFNQTKHTRIQQYYQGYPVWGAEAVMHSPKGASISLNGIFYQELNQDLNNTPAYVFSEAQADKALQTAISLFEKQSGMKTATIDIQSAKKQLLVYIDENNKAHWAFLVSFVVGKKDVMPKQPTYILDALNFSVYEQWDDVKTLDNVSGGGFGGNEKMGKLTYDGLASDLPPLAIQRDKASNHCLLQNPDVTVKDANKEDAVSTFDCSVSDSNHNQVFWNGDLDAVNGAYSPANDALFIGKAVKDMYQEWYHVPVLAIFGQPMMLNMRVHVKDWDGGPLENAYWDGQQMSFGDGRSRFYPLVSFGVGAHEVSHGFTQQHSNLVYEHQSGGLNESFSDMAAQAAEFFGYGHNNWQIGPEIFKEKDRALRYMDEPTKDCYGKKPGNNCSISNVKDYKKTLNVHYSSGIFNKVFYLIGTTKGWDTRKAFDIMVQANMNYWTANTSFEQAACGVLKATVDYQYDVDAVKQAFTEVGIKTDKCKAKKKH